MTTKFHVLFSLALSIAVIVAVVWGVTLVGSPGSARVRRFDQQRLEDLQTIFREVQSLCQDPDIKDELKRPLPRNLDELAELAGTCDRRAVICAEYAAAVRRYERLDWWMRPFVDRPARPAAWAEA